MTKISRYVYCFYSKSLAASSLLQLHALTLDATVLLLNLSAPATIYRASFCVTNLRFYHYSCTFHTTIGSNRVGARSSPNLNSSFACFITAPNSDQLLQPPFTGHPSKLQARFSIIGPVQLAPPLTAKRLPIKGYYKMLKAELIEAIIVAERELEKERLIKELEKQQLEKEELEKERLEKEFEKQELEEQLLEEFEKERLKSNKLKNNDLKASLCIRRIWMLKTLREEKR